MTLHSIMRLAGAGLVALTLGGCSVTAVQMPAPDSAGPRDSVSAPALNADLGARLNAARAQAGLPAVSVNGTLERIAQGHAQDMVRNGFFGHASSDGATLGQRARAGGYGFCAIAENIAQGQDSVAEVHQTWMTSTGHRANNLSSNVTEYGLARVGDTWVLVLARGGC